METKSWLPTLITDTPEEGYELAMTISRKAIAMIQTDEEVRKKLRPAYSEDVEQLLRSAEIVALNFQTIAAANNYWCY